MPKHVTKSIKENNAKTRTPTINAALSSIVDLSPYKVAPIFNVFGTTKKGNQVNKATLCKNDDEIYVEKKSNDTLLDKSKCIKWNNPLLKRIMMHNFKSNKLKIDCSKMIGPKQYLSNCWFNTFFMCFFISEHSQKFFRHLRQVMIEGKTLSVGSNPNKPLHSKLVKPMFLLNSLIDACLTGNIIGALNTNVIIDLLYKTKLSGEFRKINAAHNPITFYKGIIHAIGQENINIQKIYLSFNNSDLYKKQSISEYAPHAMQRISKSSNGVANYPDLLIIETASLQGKRKELALANRKNKRLFSEYVPNYMKTLKERIELNGIMYILDCVVLRDNSHAHFSAFLTCDGKEKWFDGAGLYKPIDFKWKRLINQNFDIDDSKYTTPSAKIWRPMKWNFMKGYFAAFYYREKK